MRARVLFYVILVCLAVACKRGRTYDRSTPEATVASFFAALSSKHLPADLDRLVSDPSEQTAWRMRCELSGCSKGRYHIVDQGERGTYSAVLYVQYAVFGSSGGPLMKSDRAPIYLERKGDVWLIRQIDDRIPVGGAKHETADAGGVRGFDAGSGSDAGAPTDSGTPSPPSE